MNYNRIEEITESYINGNISTTKKAIKRMTKLDFLNFILTLAQMNGAGCDDEFQEVFIKVRRLVE